MKKFIASTLIAGAVLVGLPATANASDLIPQPTSCPAGYKGVIVGVSGRDVYVCTNVVGDCPNGDTGVSVSTASGTVMVCLRDLLDDIQFEIAIADLFDNPVP